MPVEVDISMPDTIYGEEFGRFNVPGLIFRVILCDCV